MNAEQSTALATHFAQLYAAVPASPAGWVTSLRQQGLEHFRALSFPTPKHEEWKYTNLSPLTKVAFKAATPGSLSEAALRALGVQLHDCTTLVFLDGHFSAEMSHFAALPAGVWAGSLATAMHEHPQMVQPHLGKLRQDDKHALTSLNTAFLSDGAFVYVPAGVSVAAPIQLLFVSTGADATACHPRTLVVAQSQSRLQLVETYAGLGGAAYLTNAVTELLLETGAQVDHTKLQQEGAGAFHIGSLHARLERDCSLRSHVLSMGGALTRNELWVQLGGTGAQASLGGLYVGRHRQHVDNNILMDHAVPHGTSQQTFKGILDDHATGVFSGKVLVREGAIKTDARQLNRSLLLSQQATATTRPQLEILADDVKCSHGATVGQLDEAALFYLRSRGLAEPEARRLLTQAFAQDILDDVPAARVRELLQRLVGRWLAADAALQEAP